MADETTTAGIATATEQRVTLTLDAEAQAQMARLEEALATERAERERAEAAAVAMSADLKGLRERLDASESEARKQRLTDMVMGRSGQDDGRRWIGNAESHVAIMEALGEGTPLFTEYVTQQRATAEQVRASGLFREVGTDASGAPAGARTKLHQLATQYRAADPALSEAQAQVKAMEEHPELYAQSLTEGR